MTTKQKTKAAILVNLTLHAFVNEISDKKIAQEVAEAHNASATNDRYMKKRIPPTALKGIERIMTKAYQYHIKATAPWLDRGIRMMAASFIISYQNQMNLFSGELQLELAKLAKKLPLLDAEAQRLRGSLYSSDIIPSADAIQNAFSIDLEFLPVPLEGDFRIDFLETKILNKFKENSKQRLGNQTQHVKDLFLTPLLRLEKVFQAESPRVRSSTIEQLLWAIENAPELVLDDTETLKFQAIGVRIQNTIIDYYDPKGRPKFDLEAMDDALDLIIELKQEFA